MGDIGTSAVAVAELRFGTSKSQRPKQNHEALNPFFAVLEPVAFDDSDAAAYGEIRAISS